MASHGFRSVRKGLPALVCALALIGVFAIPASAAKTKVGTTFVKSSAGTKILVTLTNTKSLSSRNKPRSVKVKAGGRTISLKRGKAASAAAGYASSWSSKVFKGSYAAKLNALGGKSVKVTFKSKARTYSARTKVVVQTGGGGGPIFASPGSDLIGNDAFNHFSKYFLNSAFSDCAAGVWPACAVEERYVHCPSGAFEYHRNTPTSGADIHTYSNITVTGANAYADGSWAVSYDENVYGGKYVWRVSNVGIATGEYLSSGGNYQTMGPLIWSQPAITWQEPTGAC